MTWGPTRRTTSLTSAVRVRSAFRKCIRGLSMLPGTRETPGRIPPASSRRRHRCVAMNPRAPVTRTRMPCHSPVLMRFATIARDVGGTVRLDARVPLPAATPGRHFFQGIVERDEFAWDVLEVRPAQVVVHRRTGTGRVDIRG